MLCRQIITTSLCAALAASGAIAISGCGGSQLHDDFTLLQGQPHISLEDLAPKGLSRGDQTNFEAPLTRDGKAEGELFGQLTVEGLPGVDGVPKSTEIQSGELEFQLSDGDIMVLGLGEYARAGWKLKDNAPDVRAIIGGTGAYAGAGGELTTTRLANGTYEQQFHFVGR